MTDAEFEHDRCRVHAKNVIQESLLENDVERENNVPTAFKFEIFCPIGLKSESTFGEFVHVGS